ncbi:MAG: secretion system protein E [Deltaproteobacteria bacterium]|nr:MAG: secretion system protein E [Deltaproteobacteria bacterium]
MSDDTPPAAGTELAVVSPPARAGSDSIARLLVRRGIISEAQLVYAKRVQAKLVSDRSLIEILKDLRQLTGDQLADALKSEPLDIRLGDLLVELGRIRGGDLEAALTIQRETGTHRKLGDILVEYGFIDEQQLIEILASKLGFPFVMPSFAQVDRELLRQVPPKMFSQNCFLPVERRNGRVLVAFADPLDLEDREAADRIFGRLVLPAIAPRPTIREAIELYRRGIQRAPVPEADDSTVVGLVNGLLDEAMQQGVSDIHIEPMKDRLRVRFRRDGVLAVHREFNLDLAPPVTTRLKVMAEADIAERRRHQDGRILYESAATGAALDLRVSFYITVHGEKIVLRLMNKKGELLALEDIGMAPRMLQQFRDEALQCPSGIMIVTGPTGAGKTTTLYSCVNALNDLETSIITAEEPVEYVIDGISQCSINPKIGVTFTETLRHIVRQDPDIIVMGEVRDAFSAETAIQAALTGHKVLTTFHTEDTVGGLLRLLNMGVEAFLIASTITCVVAQRLLRRVCPKCAVPYTPTPEEYRRLGYTHGDLAGAELMIGRGCAACRFTGYKGRVGIFELLILSEPVKEAVMARKTTHEIRRLSIESAGLVTLFEDGIAKAARGKVSLPEVLKRLPRLDRPRPLFELRRLLGE